jgi:O-acetyl-ADP-ribose deacetylase (regulator of RNase III)
MMTEQQQWLILGCAVVALGLGLALALGGRPRPGVPRPRVRLVLAWLVVALCPVFLIFLFFPDSSVEAQFSWGRAGGAIGAFLVVWLLGVRNALAADKAESDEGRVLAAERGPQAVGETGSLPVSCGDLEFYDLTERPRRSIALTPGGLSEVTFADVWISSENTNMQMARYYDRSVSGVVRYLGARRDFAGDVEEDVVGAALAERMAGRPVVPLGTVLDTVPGQLASTHGVQRLFHVAAVWGELERGYAPAADVAGCARKALQCVERFAAATGGVRSVLLPLLATGTARGEPGESIPAVLDAAVDHLERNRDGAVRTIYVTAYTQAEMATCRQVLDADDRLRPARTVKRGSLHPTGQRSEAEPTG